MWENVIDNADILQWKTHTSNAVLYWIWCAIWLMSESTDMVYHRMGNLSRLCTLDVKYEMYHFLEWDTILLKIQSGYKRRHWNTGDREIKYTVYEFMCVNMCMYLCVSTYVDVYTSLDNDHNPCLLPQRPTTLHLPPKYQSNNGKAVLPQLPHLYITQQW